MERKQALLSLGAWPAAPGTHARLPLSPISRRILAKVHLAPHDLLPLAQHASDLTEDALALENARRAKQAAILGEIRSKHILGEDYNTPSASRPKSPCSVPKPRPNASLSRFSPAHDHSPSQFSNVKVIQALSRIRSDGRLKLGSLKTPQQPHRKPGNEDSDYFVHYNPHRHRHHKQEESKGSEHKKSAILPDRHSEYGSFVFPKNSKCRGRANEAEVSASARAEDSRELCHELLTTMERWEQLDEAHLRELRRMGALSPREKERLAKMQETEKAEMRKRMQRIKSRLSSQSRLTHSRRTSRAHAS